MSRTSPGDEVAPRPRFSILTSAYRTERYLAETIDSVLAQTVGDWELIVVDNGMSDEIVRIVERYVADPRIRLLRQENRGLAGGVDAAAAVARGSWFVVLDSDDQLTPDFCARIAAVVDAHPEIDVLGIDAFVFADDEDRERVRGYRHSVGARPAAGVERRVTLAEMLRGDVLYYTAAIRAEAWKLADGYTCDTPMVEDLALFIRMLVAGCDVRVLDERLARYRLRGDSSSRDDMFVEPFEASLERAFGHAATLVGDPEVHDAVAVALRRLHFDQAMRRARCALLVGDGGAALRHARAALAARRSPRAALVIAGLIFAPRLLRRVHPVKQRVTTAAIAVARAGMGTRPAGDSGARPLSA